MWICLCMHLLLHAVVQECEHPHVVLVRVCVRSCLWSGEGSIKQITVLLPIFQHITGSRSWWETIMKGPALAESWVSTAQILMHPSFAPFLPPIPFFPQTFPLLLLLYTTVHPQRLVILSVHLLLLSVMFLLPSSTAPIQLYFLLFVALSPSPCLSPLLMTHS